MKRLGPVKARKLERALAKLGYECVRTVGSHRIYQNEDTGRRTTVAFHSGGAEVPAGTVKAILEDIGMDWQEFQKLI